MAQNHARNAANAPNPALAATEHEQAASQFAAAAKTTGNLEASRTLELLERHHKRLAELIKLRIAQPSVSNIAHAPEPVPASNNTSAPSSQQPRDASPYRSQPPTVPLPQRDITSSIASNLASARGIPSNRQRRSQPSPLPSRTPKPDAVISPRRSKLIEEAYRNRDSLPQKLENPGASSTQPSSEAPSTESTSQTPLPVSDTPQPKSDELFNKFYSTFESLFSRISSPLAFAGLPLNPDEPTAPSTPNISSSSTLPKAASSSPNNAPPQKASSSRHRPLEASQRASADPDYSALFSRAALRAVAEEHGPGSVGANESFYVVPTSGHTLAYADILARQHHERRQLDYRAAKPNGEADDDDFEGDEELFVDARETPGPPSPEMNRRRGGKQKGGAAAGTRTMEELQLENETMKTLLDQTSRRLLEFEMSAQSSSVALQRSIRQLSHANKGASASASAVEGEKEREREAEERMRRMEEEVLGKVKEMKRMERENEKLKGVVGRYRDRFESIKAGARARRSGEDVAGTGTAGVGGKKGEERGSSTG
ncbi:hypothetical protein Q9189_001690 [Teloschistes chrysophthalmus]